MSNKNMNTKLSVNFTKASTKQNITSGENISTSFGKISKYLDDLGSAAFTDSSDYATLTALGNKVDKVTGKELMPSDLLDSNGNVSLSHLPDIVLGQMIYGGTVNASNVATLSSNAKTKLGTTNNTITLTNNTASITGYVANEGIYYIATGNATLANLGIKTGDWLLSTGSAWKKIDNTDEVSSVNNKTGAVTLNASDVSAVSINANQGLTDTQKANARTNIGAGTSSFDGNYNSLSNKPTIPTVNNGTLTIQQNGTTKATFTANQAGNTTANLTDTTYSAGDTMTLDNTTFNIGKRWTAVSKGQTWSRLFYSVRKYANIGSAGILSISATRDFATIQATFLIISGTAYVNKSVEIIEIASNNYFTEKQSTIRVRAVTGGAGYYYFEIYDTAYNIAVGTEQTWNCRYIPLLESTLTPYTSFTDGTTIPENCVAVNDFTTDIGSNAVAIKNITRNGNTFTATRQDGSTFTFDQNGDFLPLTAVTTSETSDTTPYLYKSSEHDAVYDELVGGSVAWNQLVQNGNFETASGWTATRSGTVSVSNNVCTITPTSSNALIGLIKDSSVTKMTTPNHKYLLSAYILSPVNGTAQLSFSGSSPISIGVTANEWKKCECIWVTTANNITERIYALITNSLTTSQTIQYKNVMAIDLTQMFGTTIADYVYTLEQSTAGSGVEWLKSYGFFTKDYYAYNAGGLVSVNTSGKKVVGKNLVDIPDKTITATAYIFNITGLNLLSGTYTFSFNSIGKTSPSFTATYEDGTDAVNTAVNNHKLTFMAHKKIVSIRLYGAADTYSNMQLELGSTATDYEPYTSITYPIQSTDLRGLYKLDSNNKIYADGDIYSADGTVTRKYGIVDLGTLDWVYITSYINPFMRATFVNGISENTNIICQKGYRPVSAFADVVNTNLSMCIVSNSLRIRDDSYTNAATFKTAMSGVYLIYELATPTTGTAQSFTSPQMVYRNGIEEYLDTRDVQIPVGGNRKYVDIPDWMVNEYFDDVRAVSDKQQAQIDKALEQSGYNLLEITTDTRTVNGVTFTVDKVAGTITANGTATALTAIPLSDQLSEILKVGNSYYMTGCPVGGAYYSTYALYVALDGATVWRDDGSGEQYSVPQSGTLSALYVLIRSGVTVSNLVFKPMIVPAELAGMPFQPYPKLNNAVRVERVAEDVGNLVFPDGIHEIDWYDDEGVIDFSNIVTHFTSSQDILLQSNEIQINCPETDEYGGLYHLSVNGSKDNSMGLPAIRLQETSSGSVIELRGTRGTEVVDGIKLSSKQHITMSSNGGTISIDANYGNLSGGLVVTPSQIILHVGSNSLTLDSTGLKYNGNPIT